MLAYETTEPNLRYFSEYIDLVEFLYYRAQISLFTVKTIWSNVNVTRWKTQHKLGDSIFMAARKSK